MISRLVSNAAALAGLLAFGSAALSAMNKAGPSPAHTTAPAENPASASSSKATPVTSGKSVTVTSPATKPAPPTKAVSPNKPATPKSPAAKPATTKLVVKAKPAVTQAARWVVTYRDDPASAAKRVTFSTLAAAESWLEGYKRNHPSASGSISRESSGGARSVK